MAIGWDASWVCRKFHPIFTFPNTTRVRFLFTSPESLGADHREASVVPEIQKLASLVQQAAEERGMLLGSVQDLLSVLKDGK